MSAASRSPLAKVSLRIPDDTRHRLERLAAPRRARLAQVAREALEHGVAELERRERAAGPRLNGHAAAVAVQGHA